MKSKYTYFILILILALVYWQWFLPGPKVANDFPLISQSYQKLMMDLPRTWSDRGAEGLGEYSIFSLWSYPATFVMGILGNIGINFEISERLFFIIPFILLGSFGIWKYLEYLGLSVKARLLSSVFYLTNTYILLVIDGGQLLISLAFAFFPLSFLMVEKAIKGGIKQKILAALSIVALGFFDIRFIFVLLLLVIILFLYGLMIRDNKLIWIKQFFILGVLTLFLFIGLNAFWLVTFLEFPLKQESFSRLTQMADVAKANIGHSFLLISPNWYKNIFGNISLLRFEFILIPILAFVAPLVRKRHYGVGFWLLIALLAIFLSKGSAEPFSKIYPFLFTNIPGFSLFRDSTKFFFLLVLAYTFLIGVTLDWFLAKFKSRKFHFLISSIIILYFLFLIRPVFLNQMSGTLSSKSNQEEFSGIANILQKDTNFSRAFWIPATFPLSYSSPTHPVVEALRFTDKRPFASGIKGTYEIFNFLREAPYMGQLFDVAGVGYIVYPDPKLTKENLHPDEVRYYSTFWHQLVNLPWVSGVTKADVPVLKVKSHQDKIFLAQNSWWVIGSDSIYNEATKSAELALNNNALIFPEESAGLGQKLRELPSANIILFNKTLTDLAASFINPENLIFPAHNLSKDPDSSGWWKKEGKDLIQWRYFLKTKYGVETQDFDLGGGWAVGENSLKLKVKSEKFKKDQVLLARIMESSRSGNLNFYQGDQLIGKIQTKIKEGTNVRWFEVGRIIRDEGIEVVSNGDINVVNALGVLPENIWQNYVDKANSLKIANRIKDFIPENTEPKAAKVTFKEIDPTKYEVTVKGLKKEAIVIFSSSFDNLWQMRNKPSLPIYSLLNGFKADKDGTYEIIFEPQKQILPGLVVSLVVLISVTGFLILKKK